MATVSHILVLIEGDAKSLNTSLAQASASTTAFSRTAATASKTSGSALSSIGRQAKSALGGLVPLAAGAAILAVGKLALEFDDAFTRIETLSTASTEDIQRWKGEVLELAGETAQAPQELADALFFLSSAGLDSTQVMEALEQSAKASAIGLGETQDVANITASALNAYSEAGLTATQVTDALVAAVKAGRAEPEEFANALGRILPIASQAGVTFQDVTASLAQLSNIGLDVNEGVTAMRGALQALITPGAMAADAMESIGLSAQDILDVIHEDGLVGAIRMVDEAAKANTETQADYLGVLREIIPNVRSLTGVLGLTAQEARAVDETFRAVTESAGATDEAMKVLEQSAGFRLRKAWNDLVVILTKVGQDVLPHIATAFEAVTMVIGPLADHLDAILLTLAGYAAIRFLPPLVTRLAIAFQLGGASASNFVKNLRTVGTLGAVVGILEVTTGLIERINGLDFKAMGKEAGVSARLLEFAANQMQSADKAWSDVNLKGLIASLDGVGDQTQRTNADHPGATTALRDLGISARDTYEHPR